MAGRRETWLTPCAHLGPQGCGWAGRGSGEGVRGDVGAAQLMVWGTVVTEAT